ncbi:PREDICTED: uncharacterized protein LOC106749330 isoform X2 [Dinoponera quadriceps]|uniref:Uncharacterized protein LOC106749330 isoform X2 n=1 Tax=Dinoponera quadriceps TaxID=609295 RepID=A0A6P3Y1T0_DINQU|nr:PREDICTED: uncharacterized protein LOC106749330 isoform X2 [Dinoponera quadriceps]
MRDDMRMRDTIITRADVYTHEMPSTSDSVIMSSGDSSPPAQATISTSGFDVPDDARLAKISPTTTPSPTTSAKISKAADHETLNTDVEAIEEAMPIVQKTLPVPELPAKIERNGFDMDVRKTLDEREEDMCLIDCIYYTQQCCNCTIL